MQVFLALQPVFLFQFSPVPTFLFQVVLGDFAVPLQVSHVHVFHVQFEPVVLFQVSLIHNVPVLYVFAAHVLVAHFLVVHVQFAHFLVVIHVQFAHFLVVIHVQFAHFLAVHVQFEAFR